MMDTEHTPLPWSYEVQAFGSAIAKDGVCIATTHGTRAIVRGDLPHEANAALIVHSVNLLPELVEALREAKGFVEWVPEMPAIGQDDEFAARNLLATIDALLAKATS